MDDSHYIDEKMPQIISNPAPSVIIIHEMNESNAKDLTLSGVCRPYSGILDDLDAGDVAPNSRDSRLIKPELLIKREAARRNPGGFQARIIPLLKA